MAATKTRSASRRTRSATKQTLPVNSLGMFDLLKGLGMVIVVLCHTLELYPVPLAGGASLALLAFIYREALMSAFFIVSGYGFRPRPVSKCIQQQARDLLVPYAWTGFFTALLHLILHYLSFHYLPGSLIETGKVLGGFALGLPHTATYFGLTLFSCGPMWYLLTLAFAWIILDALLTRLSAKQQVPAILLVMLAGWLLGAVADLPFCIAQSMMAVPYLYIGYRLKKTKALEKLHPRRLRMAFLASALLIALGAALRGASDSMSDGYWTLGPVSILLNCVFSVGSVHLFTGLNRYQNRLTRLLQELGRRSLYIFCLHTIENIAVPWYALAEKFSAHPILGALLQFALRCLFIYAGCALLEFRRRLRRPVRSKQRRRSQSALRARH